MQAHVLRGTKQEIADRVSRMPGEVREVIVFVDEPAMLAAPHAADAEGVFAEMRLYMVDVDDVNDSREAIHTRMQDE